MSGARITILGYVIRCYLVDGEMYHEMDRAHIAMEGATLF